LIREGKNIFKNFIREREGIMNVEELEAELKLIKDKSLDVRVLSPYSSQRHLENIWLVRVEVSDKGNSGYECFGEVRLMGENRRRIKL
tara:strand:+ start:243 stop:506 length:264 start_codon:yes stop_codon:yes gene_type:complete